MLYEQTRVNITIRESISLYDLVTWQLAHAGHLVPLYVFYITVHMYVCQLLTSLEMPIFENNCDISLFCDVTYVEIFNTVLCCKSFQIYQK